MANLPEQSLWESVRQFEEEDELRGGPNGIDNVPLKQLVNRTRYLKDQVESKADAGHNHDGVYSPVGHNHDADYATPAYVDSKTTPVGMIMAWSTEVEPAGFLPCEGAAIDRVTYADLFAVIGTRYGDGNGETTFNLPDYRGYFLRGWDNGAGNDPDAATRADRGDGTTGDHVGTIQDDEVGPHTHNYTSPIGAGADDGGPSNLDLYPDLNAAITTTNAGDETRPINKSVLFVIKY